MPSPDPQRLIEDPDRDALLRLASHSIQYGLANGRALSVDPVDYSPTLQVHRASFVTLEKKGTLRGCIGNLEPTRPLVIDTADNAYAAAFRDPRFSPLAPDELPGLEIHVSVLSVPEGMDITCEQDLLSQLQPGIDGLVLEEGRRRATFLPSVWESLTTPTDFVTQLKIKAGWKRSYWSDGIRALRYTADIIGP